MVGPSRDPSVLWVSGSSRRIRRDGKNTSLTPLRPRRGLVRVYIEVRQSLGHTYLMVGLGGMERTRL